MSPISNRRFDSLDRPDRYDDRLETERVSGAASYAACGLALLLPPGCQHIWHAPTIRAEIADHNRRMAEGMARLKLHDEQRKALAK